MTSLRRAGVLAGLGAAVAATAGCSTTPVAQTSSTPAAASSSAQAGPTDSTARRITASFKVGAKIGPIAVGDGWVWATNTNATVVGQGGNGTTPNLVRIDRASNKVTATVDLAANPWVVLVDGGHVDVGLAGALVDVDASTMRVTGEYSLPGEPTAMAATPGALWVAFARDGSVVRFDTATHAVTATVHIADASVAAQQDNGEPSSLVAAGGSVWATMDAAGKVARIDPSSATITATYALPAGKGGQLVAAADGSVWISSGGSLAHLDTKTGASQALTVEVPDGGPLVARGNDLWVAGAANKLYHVDVAAGRIVETVAFTGGAVGIADDGNAVWVASLADNLTRIDTQ